MLQSRPHILPIHREGHAHRVRSIGNDNIHEGVQRILALVTRDLFDGAPLIFFNSRLITLVIRIRAAPSGQSGFSLRISARARARVAGAPSCSGTLARPPSRTHGGRLASKPCELAIQGYWSADTSSPCARQALPQELKIQLSTAATANYNDGIHRCFDGISRGTLCKSHTWRWQGTSVTAIGENT